MNQKIKATLLILLIFAFGVITGILLSNFSPIFSLREHRDGAMLRRLHKSGYYQRITEDLNFTPEQEDRFKQVMERHAQRMQALFEKNKPKMRQSWNLLMADLDSFLTANQKIQLENRLKERRRFKSKREAMTDSSTVKMNAKLDTLK